MQIERPMTETNQAEQNALHQYNFIPPQYQNDNNPFTLALKVSVSESK